MEVGMKKIIAINLIVVVMLALCGLFFLLSPTNNKKEDNSNAASKFTWQVVTKAYKAGSYNLTEANSIDDTTSSSYLPRCFNVSWYEDEGNTLKNFHDGINNYLGYNGSRHSGNGVNQVNNISSFYYSYELSGWLYVRRHGRITINEYQWVPDIAGWQFCGVDSTGNSSTRSTQYTWYKYSNSAPTSSSSGWEADSSWSGKCYVVYRWNYDLSFISNGGSNDGPDPTYFYSGVGITIPSTEPTREGYRFLGWSRNRNATKADYEPGDKFLDTSADTTESISLYAVWEPITTRITLEKNGGSGGSSSVTATYGSAMPTITVPTRTGYTFNGYFISESSNNGTGTKYYNSDGTSARTWNVDASTDTLYAGWTIESYRINYDAGEGSVSPTYEDVDYNERITLPTPEPPDGYYFTGWSYGGRTYTGSYTVPDFGADGTTVTFTAQYEEETYIFYYNANGGSVTPTQQTVQVGDTIILPTPTRTGYTYLGWLFDNQGNDTPVSGSLIIMGDMGEHNEITFLTAQWSIESYRINYDANGGSVSPDSDTVNYNESITLPTPTRTGYAFTGWKYGSSTITDMSYTVPDFGASGTEVTFEAQWSKESYTIEYDANGGSVSVASVDVEYGQTITLPTPTRTGYTFNGWRYGSTNYTGSYTVPDFGNNGATVTFTAQWTIESYRINYDAGEGSVSPTYDDVSYGNRITLPTPTRTGYTFNGWRYGSTNYSGSYTVPDFGNNGATVTFTAQWSLESYTINYDANGGSVSPTTDTVNYNERITLPTPTRAGYTFTGWEYGGSTYTGSYTVPDFGNNGASVTFTAQWTANKYTIIFDEVGGSEVSDIVDYTIESTISFPSTTKAGYDFVNWKVTKADGNWTNGATFNANTTTTDKYGNVTLTAQWNYHTYTVTLDPNGGEVSPTSIRVTYQSTYGSLPTPTRDGYVFKGWYTSETSGTQILSTTKYTSTQDTTIYAQWQDTWANHASDALTSEDGYYLVSSEEDLARVSYLLNCTTRTDVQTMKFKLTKNLDMSDYTWLPIGTQSRQFRGTFDGNGYIISGLNTYYNSSIASTYTNIGLFGYVNGATIQNLYLRDTDIRGGSNVGGLIGYATGNTQVTSCAFDGSITANSNGGSIVGLGATSVIVSNCTVFSSNTTADTNGMARGCSVRSLVYITNDTKGYIGTDFSNYVFVEGMPAPVPTGLSWLAQGGEPCDLADIEEWASEN